MYSKIKITGEIEVLTGMHIGGFAEFSAIGAVDSPVIKDALTHQPIIPGSTLKGKLRTMLARKYNKNVFQKHNEDHIFVGRLFGSAKKDSNNRPMPSRLLFSDSVITPESRENIFSKGAMSVTEIKFENTINRATGVANPRQIERVVRGAVFPLEIIYEVINENEISEDFEHLAESLSMLQNDYIGGNGSRGYGRIKFNNLDVKVLFGSVDKETQSKCLEYLKGVNNEV